MLTDKHELEKERATIKDELLGIERERIEAETANETLNQSLHETEDERERLNKQIEEILQEKSELDSSLYQVAREKEQVKNFKDFSLQEDVLRFLDRILSNYHISVSRIPSWEVLMKGHRMGFSEIFLNILGFLANKSIPRFPSFILMTNEITFRAQS